MAVRSVDQPYGPPRTTATNLTLGGARAMLYPYPPRCSALYQKLRNQPDTVKGAITDRNNTQWQCDLSINRTARQGPRRPISHSEGLGRCCIRTHRDAARSTRSCEISQTQSKGQ